MIETINPATEKLIKTYPFLDEEQVLAAIEAAELNFQIWKKVPIPQRQRPMREMARLLRLKKQELAKLITTEMGKPIQAAQAEIEKCAWVCEHYAEQASRYLKPRTIKTDMQKTKVYYEPLGIVLAIMPWNFPFWQVFRFAAPTLMAGNAALLKPAPITYGCGYAIAELFIEAGFPKQLLQTVALNNEQVAKVISHPRIVAVTLTGSGRAGSAVAANAGQHLKKSVLELGGSDPYIVLADADIALAAKSIVASRLNNCGQVCIAAKRTIAVEPVYQRLVEEINSAIDCYQMGDPLEKDTLVGPMARSDLRETLHKQVTSSINKHAKLVRGGEIPQKIGFYYPPTLLINVQPGTPAFDEELFGPVISVTSAKDEKDAIRLANHTPYGLAAAIFTQDSTHGEYLAAHEIESGTCFVNAIVSSDPRVPFGGIKQSGFGRELSKEGILEFVNIKTISVQ